jgi:protein-tyrosine phosphatase
MTRAAVKYAMEEIAYEHKNLYFHCRIGTDRTGTVAYVLEGLLGVPEEDRIQDYELSFFYGLVRVHRYHNEKPGSSVGTGKERFVYMHNFMPTNEDIYDWYMKGSTNTAEDIALINSFKAAMIESN